MNGLVKARLLVAIVVAALVPTSPWALVGLVAADQESPAVIATVDLGDLPFGIAGDPATTRVYVAHPGDDQDPTSSKISVIDASTNERVDTITVGQAPIGVAVDRKTGLLWVTSNLDSRALGVDPRTHDVVSDIPLRPGDPEWIAINPKTSLAYVTHFPFPDRTWVDVLDLSTNTNVGFIEVGNGQGAITVDPKQNLIHVGRWLFEGPTRVSEIVVIDGSTNVVIDRIQLSLPLVRDSRALVRGLPLDPNGKRLYVAHRNSDRVSVLDLKHRVPFTPITPIATIPVGLAPHGVLFNPQDDRVYVGNTFPNTVSVIDADQNSVVATLPAGPGSRFLALNSRTGRIYVANLADTTVTVIGTHEDED